MAIKTEINNTSSNSFSIGDGLPTNVDGYLLFETGNTNKPGIKYDTISSTVKFSNDGYIWNNVGSLTLGRDLSNTTNDAYVKGFNGIPLSTTESLLDGYAYVYNQSRNKWVPGLVSRSSESLTLGGDLSNTINSAHVVGFNNIPLSSNLPQDGYSYIYNSLINEWIPSKISNNSIITVGKQDLLTSNATNYLLPNFCESTDEIVIAFFAPVAGTLSNLICYCNTAPGGSETVVITVRKNEVDTAITATLTGSDISAFDIIHLANIGSGDKITFKSVTSSGCAAKDLFVSLLFTIPSTNAALPSFGFYIVPIDIVFNAGQSINTSNNSMRVSSRTIDFSQYPIMSDYKVRTAKFVAILEAQGSSGTTANIELFDATNSVTITGSALSTILNSPTYLTSAALTMGTSSGNLRIDANTLYDVRLAMTNNNLTTDAVICCYSALIITYV